MDDRVRAFLERVAKFIKDGECTLHGSDAECQIDPDLCALYDMPSDDAVDIVAWCVDEARALLKPK